AISRDCKYDALADSPSRKDLEQIKRPRTSGSRPVISLRPSLRNGDLSRLDVLCFRQSQFDQALVDLRTDLVCVDRWVEFEPAPEIFQARFAMDQRSFHSGKRTPSGDRELVVLDRDIEPILVDPRHF